MKFMPCLLLVLPVTVCLAADAPQATLPATAHLSEKVYNLVAAYRMKQQGWSLADAETEMQVFGFNDVWTNFKKFIRQYGAELKK